MYTAEALGEKEIVNISTQRQITIPQKYFYALGFSGEAECILQDGGIFIRPLQVNTSSEFAEYILADLIAQGYEGQQLLALFKEHCHAVRPAVRKLIDEADAFAQSGQGHIPLEELFGEAE